MKLVVIIGLILICATCKKEVVDYRDKYCGFYNTTVIYSGEHVFFDSTIKQWNSKFSIDTMKGISFIFKHKDSLQIIKINFFLPISFRPHSFNYYDSSFIDFLPDSLENSLLFARIDENGIYNANSSISITVGFFNFEKYYVRTTPSPKFSPNTFTIHGQKNNL
ncbi:MAG: hypothetical protein KA797_04130 [Chitinophagales bacterium]|nr:hypothetical protein [Chitinophagales bacterium]